MLIGLSVNHKDGLSCISNAYVNAVIKAGGTPVLIPLNRDGKQLEEILSRLDGLIFSGGGDLHASFFNEELHASVTDADALRDEYDLKLVRLALKRQMPVFGICRGLQAINVAMGGSLIQDIPSQVPASNIKHSQEEAREIGTHKVSIDKESLLYKIVKTEELLVNSFHHQAIKALAPGMKAVAYSSDNIVEAFESEEGYSVFGVQWHPETMAVAEDKAMLKLFEHVVSEADLYKQAKELHQHIVTIDSHTDTPMYFKYGVDISKNNKTIKVNPADLGAEDEDGYVDCQIKVDVPKMQEGVLDAAVMVAYIPQGALSEKASERAVEKTFTTLKTLQTQIETNKYCVGQARNSEDIRFLKRGCKKAILLGLENGYGIGKDIKNVERLSQMGVVYITLSHNGDNDICDAAVRTKQTHNGLSEFGKEVVKEMNRLGIIVDISHTSEKTSFDVLALSEYPIIASHSSAKALCNHPRNISDELMKAIAGKGGVIQVCLYTGFLKKGGVVKVKDAVDHIDYIANLVGIDHVGIGSDFDGGGGFTGLKDASELIQITIELLRRGYTEEAIEKIWGANFMRVMDSQSKVYK